MKRKLTIQVRRIRHVCTLQNTCRPHVIKTKGIMSIFGYFWRELSGLAGSHNSNLQSIDGESENSELRTIYDLEAKLADVSLPFKETVPAAVKDWLNVLTRSHGTTREMVLLSVLTSTSALIGKSSLQVFSTHEEVGNLFVVVVSPSGSGKTPACHLGCIDPIVEHFGPKINKNLRYR